MNNFGFLELRARIKSHRIVTLQCSEVLDNDKGR